MSALQLLVALLLVLANGFFVGAEFALVSVRRSQIEPLAAAGSARAGQVVHGLEHLPQMMAAAQLGITVCSLTLGAVAEPTVARLLEPVFQAARVPDGLIHPLGYAIALAVVVFLHLVVGEMVPKNLAMAAPEKTALWFGPGLVAFARLSRPVTAALGWCARLVLGLFRVESREEVASVFTSEQLNRLVGDSGQAGLLEPGEQERLEDALGLGSRPLTDVLLGRSALVTVDPSVTPRRIEELTVRTGFSRFPVCAPGPAGAFMGYIHVKDVLDLDDAEGAVPHQVWRPMTTLRAELALDDALSVMRRAGTHLAQVADGSGRVLGLVALEDVLEMLVGEVRDPAHRVVPLVAVRTRPTRPRPETHPQALTG
ncbi:hemolysin family protein [Streptomyces candidus]|uniref:CBS domain containing-hemolysin-like protein n=1 Tax=Streptomyces candidus TaxID=67283 RepID=A0A7X0HEW2_9ACTN|nr:hemolysin family protein [Streptomyces candidus]MBB6436233.1 CBS domain containing-hemolysin-like protein [Streptomyces candidus]GHH48230.1 membrane protein [Streptomyces candidus]